MITEKQLEEICKEYEIDYNKLIEKNENILAHGKYEEIKSTLEYLRKTIKIATKNVEKCPSILYYKPDNIIKNWEFLKEHEITISNVESCLHVLSTEHGQMKKTYEYVIDNYGVRYLNAITSILSVQVERIQEIEERFKERFKKKNFLQAAISRFNIEEIEKIVKVCQKNEIEISGSVFLKPAEEIEKIVEICKKNEIEISGSVFLKPSKQLEENIDYVKENFGEEYLKPLIISRSKKNLSEILPYLKEKGVLSTVKTSASILSLTLDEVKEREKYINQIGEELVSEGEKRFNSIFGLSRKRYKEKCKTISKDEIGQVIGDVPIEEKDMASRELNTLIRENKEKMEK